MKSCRIASISRLNAYSNPIRGNPIGVALHDPINASCSLHISTITLGDAILVAIYNRSRIKSNHSNKSCSSKSSISNYSNSRSSNDKL
jgi:hypothetical protein